MRWFYVVFAAILICASPVHGEKIEPEIYEELQKQNSVSVIVELHDIEPVSILSMDRPEVRQKQLELRKIRIQNKRAKLLARLDIYPVGVLGIQSGDGIVTREYSTINAFAGNITRDALQRLERDSEVKKVYLQRELYVQLDDTIGQIEANITQLLSIDNTSIDGRGETVCVLDTGVDYNHTNLGAGMGNVVLDGYD